MPSTVVRPRRSTAIAPRSPRAQPAAAASRVSGADPGPEHDQVGGQPVAVDDRPPGRRRRARSRSRWRRRGRRRPPRPAPPPPGAVATGDSAGSTCGAISTTVTWAPRARSASAISSPIGPLPTSTARGRTCGASASSSARADRRSRSTWTPGRCAPGIPGRTGRAPVATTSAPYGTSAAAGQRAPAAPPDRSPIDLGADAHVDVARAAELLGRRRDERRRGPPPRRR